MASRGKSTEILVDEPYPEDSHAIRHSISGESSFIVTSSIDLPALLSSNRSIVSREAERLSSEDRKNIANHFKRFYDYFKTNVKGFKNNAKALTGKIKSMSI